MKILRTPGSLRAVLKEHRHKQIGFVPTMGYFHDGHLSLMKRAVQDNDITVVSIFVNPLQFGPNEDLDKYPRDEDRDTELAENQDIDYLFIPTVESMYPHDMHVRLMMNNRTDVLCGASRPGHFDGVITVLAKLFHIVQPDKVYMGMKDAQQFAVVDAFCQDLNFPLELVGVPTVREEDGLAKSSRNVFLSEAERNEAPAINNSLKLGQTLAKSGEKDTSVITACVKEAIEKETSGTIDYVELYRYPELTVTKDICGTVILAVAVRFSNARLIDNVIFEV